MHKQFVASRQSWGVVVGEDGHGWVDIAVTCQAVALAAAGHA